MAKKAAKTPSRRGMTIYPPASVAGPLGAYNVRAFQQACRFAAQQLRLAAAEVSALFDQAEWETLACALASREIEPEIPGPSSILADLVAYQQALQGTKEKEGKAKSAPLVERLRNLSYVQAWAVVIAVQFKSEYGDRIEEGAHWWEVPTRQAIAWGETQEE